MYLVIHEYLSPTCYIHYTRCIYLVEGGLQLLVLLLQLGLVVVESGKVVLEAAGQLLGLQLATDGAHQGLLGHDELAGQGRGGRQLVVEKREVGLCQGPLPHHISTSLELERVGKERKERDIVRYTFRVKGSEHNYCVCFPVFSCSGLRLEIDPMGDVY